MSFSRFAEHGGPYHHHQVDGWGLATWEGRAVRLLKEPEAAVDSPWVRLVEGLDLQAAMLIAHVRRATVGSRCLANTQPFVREVHGRHHVFAHNGHLGVLDVPAAAIRQPIGDTDSERAFCLLLQQAEDDRSEAGGALPSIRRRTLRILGLLDQLSTVGPCNVMYGDGDALFCYGDRRRQPGQPTTGLWVQEHTCDQEEPIAHRGLRHRTQAPNRLVRVASVPLDDKPWRPLARGTLLVLQKGTIVNEVAHS